MKKNLLKENTLLKIMSYFSISVGITLMMVNLSLASSVKGQNNLLEQQISLSFHQITLKEALTKIEDQGSFKFIYSNSKLPLLGKVSKTFKNRTVKQVLDDLLHPFDIKYAATTNHKIVLTNRDRSPKKQPVALARGIIKGLVKDKEGNVLSYASVTVVGIGGGTVSGIDGKFVLRLPEGNHQLKVAYIGYNDKILDVTVAPSKTVTVEIILEENVAALEGVTVYGNLYRGQAKALNEQKNALNIKNVVAYEQFSKFPDRNAAEALQRIPGVGISRDQGEGELVSIRGMSPRFNAVQINGQRIPSPDPDNDRAVGLDLLQVDLMESIVVNKTLTPEMDGDAIGGSVNFNLKQAPEEAIVQVNASGGFNQQQSYFRDFETDLQAYSAVLGRRFFKNKLGFIAAGSYYKTNRGSLLHQYTYVDDTEEIEEKRNNDYDVRRERYGLLLSPDWRINENHSLKFVFNYNVYDDDEIRRRADYLVGDGEEEREVRNRGEYQTHYLYQLAGKHNFQKFNLDYSLNLTQAEEAMPNRTYWRFDRDVDYSGLNNQQLFDLEVRDNPGGDVPLFLNRVRYDNNLTRDKDISGKLNIEVPFNFKKGRSKLKFGGKYLHKDRISDQRRFQIRVDSDDNPVPMNGGEWILGDVRFDDPQAAALGLPSFSEDEDRGDDEDYNAEENVLAAYVMATLNWNEKFSTLFGARYERTSNEYGDRSAFFDTSNKFTYGNLLPSAQAKYKFNDNTNLKVAYSTGFTRPQFHNLLPLPDGIDRDERTIVRRNPNLKPSHANNVDVIFEKYSANLGVFSIGVFGKFIDNQLQRERFTEVINDTLFTVTSVVNGETARSLGFEVAYNHKFINAGVDLLKWFGIYSNYTFTDSEQKVEDRTLPFESPRHVLNMGILYENPKMGLSFTLSGVYRSSIFIALGRDEFSDVYFGKQFHMDFSASKSIGKRLTIFTQINNLTDEEETEIFSDPSEDFSRLHQTEGYGFWGSIGIKFEL